MTSVTKLWIWLSLRCAPAAAWCAWRHFGSVEQLYLAEKEELRQIKGLRAQEIERLCEKSTERAERILGRCAEREMYLLCWDDEEYPEQLRELHLPPMVLYCWGQRLALREECIIAMAGTRRCSAYGRSMAEHFSANLTRYGALVLTGMASGCDEAALRAALRQGGPVAALLPGGCDVPFENTPYYRSLYRDVRQMGVLLSPYPPGTPNDHKHFFYRNPILTGLSAATLCVEAGVPSGVLNVAAHANEQGRTLYVIPANLDSNCAAGTNALMCSGVALPVMSAKDILLPLQDSFPRVNIPKEEQRGRKHSGKTGSGGKSAPKPAQPTSPVREEKKVDTGPQADYIDRITEQESFAEEELVLLRALREGEKTAEELSAHTHFGSARTLSALTLLTLRGALEELEGGRFRALVRLPDDETEQE